MDYSETLKSLRNSLGLNQTEFGESIGLSQQEISDYENGRKNPSQRVLKLLEYRYGVKNKPGGPKSPRGSTILTGRTQPYADGEAVPILGELKLEEVELIRALREIDQISRVGVLASAIQQLNEAMRDREIKKDKNKKKILENAIKVLSNAIGQS